MTNFTVTIDANFASGNTMEAAHWSGAVDDIEALLQGAVGRDGVGIDNWDGNEALRGLNFRRNGLVEAVRRSSAGPASVVPGVTLTTGDGVNPSPAPGGCARFHLRAAAPFALVHFQARVIYTSTKFTLQRSMDNGTAVVAGDTEALLATNQSTWCRATWLETSLAAGWHTVEHRIAEFTDSEHIVFDQTELIVLAAYQ